MSFISRWFPTDDPKKFTKDVGIGIAAGTAMYGTDSLVTRLFTRSKIPPVTKAPLFHPGARILLPLAEECLFRGVMRDYEPKDSPIRSIWGNSALFALAHIRYNRGLIGNMRVMPLYFGAGCALWSLAESTHNLWGSTAAHATFNHLMLKRGF